MRNQLLIAIPFNATEAEIEAAHAAIDLHFADGVAATTDTATGTGPVSSSAPANTSGAELDSDGLPWDERIHSSNKKMTDKGKWVARRNVPDATRASVIAEIRATMANGAVGQQQPQQTPAATTAPGLGAPGASGLALPGATGGLPSLPGASAVDPRYTHLVQLIGRNTKSDANPAGLIDAAWLHQVLTHFGVTDGSLQTLAHNLARIDEITAFVTQTLTANGGVA